MNDLTVISHIYNEEYLLPFWLDHHSKFFKNGIIIDYMSTDNSLDIIRKKCPHWKIIKTKNIIDNKPNFEAEKIDSEVQEIEKTINGYKICLNTTEFLFFDIDKINFFDQSKKNCFGIKVFVGLSKNDYFIPKNYEEFTKNIDLISENHDRGQRFIHNYEFGNYNIGRHYINKPSVNIFPNMFIFHIANYNLNEHFVKRRMQIQNNIPIKDKERGFGYQHILKSENDIEKNRNNIKRTTLDIKLNEGLYDIVNKTILFNQNIHIYYPELFSDAKWGDNKIILKNDVNLLEKTDFNDKGYKICQSKNYNNYLRNFIENKIYEITDKKIILEDYHKIITDKEHATILHKMPYNKYIDNEFEKFCLYLENFISEVTKEKVKIFNDDVWVRICRPIDLSVMDFNPYHKDIYLDFYRNVVNIYVPIAGSNEKSSLTVQEGSHMWNENTTMITENGAYFKSINKKYSVDAIVASKIPINMTRPNPDNNQILIFSPYLVHGGAHNENNDITRFSLEVRFIKDNNNSVEQEKNYREFLKTRVWR